MIDIRVIIIVVSEYLLPVGAGGDGLIFPAAGE